MGNLANHHAVAILDPDDERPLPPNVSRILHKMDRFYQDGSFLDAMPYLRADSVVILADADAVLQRPPSPVEIAAFQNVGHGIAIGYNDSSKQRGMYELGCLGLHRPLIDAAAVLQLPVRLLAEAKVYNWGLVGMSVETWRFLRRVYAAHTRNVNPGEMFTRPTWMQYVLCLLVSYYGLSVTELGYETHTHTHTGRPQEEHQVRKNGIYYKGELVFFAHGFGDAEQSTKATIDTITEAGTVTVHSAE